MNRFPSLHCDLGAYQHLISKDEPYPFESALRVVELLVAGIGAERIHWGTDWPYLRFKPYTDLLQAIHEAPFLEAAQVDLILGGNALQFVEG